MAYFTNYCQAHGYHADITAVILDREDAQFLARQGFEVGGPIAAEGIVGERTELLITKNAGGDRLRPFMPAEGRLIFSADPRSIRIQSATGERPLARTDDISVNHLRVVERKGRIWLTSTARSRVKPPRKRNTAASRQARSAGSPDARARVPSSDHPEQGTDDGKQPGLIVRWDDGLGLRLPPDAAARAGFEESTRVDIEVPEKGRLIVTRSRRHFTLEELLVGMTPEREHRLEDDGPRGEERI